MFYKKVGLFEIRAFYDQGQNTLINKVTYKRKLVETEVLDDHISKSYIGYRLILDDLKNIVLWAKLVLDYLEKKEKTDTDNVVLHSLFISIVTTYWKCFADTKGRNGTQLNCSICPKKYVGIHNEIKRIRNNFTAHSGDDPFESGYLLKVMDCHDKNRFGAFTLPIHRKAQHGDKKLTNNIILLVEAIIEEIKIKQEKRLQKIMDELF